MDHSNPRLDLIIEARNLIQDETPLPFDCGELCKGACCKGDDETGMLLLPGEEELYTNCSFGHVLPANYELGGVQAKLFVCNGTCERENRPFSCRVFPLVINLSNEKSLVQMDPRAKGVCPLAEFNLSILKKKFVPKVEKAYYLLLTDSELTWYFDDLTRLFFL